MSESTKIVDLISKDNGGKPYVSLEYFPPRTAEGVKNLYKRMERMKQAVKPVFSDITWGAGGSTADLSLELALNMQKTGHNANLHMTCTNLSASADDDDAKKTDPKEQILKALQESYDGNIRNIVALRGDPPHGEEKWEATEGGFTCALDLVKFIREHFGNDFGIAVAGYPEGHPNAISEVTDISTLTEQEKLRTSTLDGKHYCCLEKDYVKEMDYLKQKVDAGADCIITQMFFDVDVFEQFQKDCKQWGILCPIIPGLMCINAYAGFVKMAKFCKTRVPVSLQQKMDELNAIDDKTKSVAAVKAFGIEFGTQMCTQLVEKCNVPVLHFYTLNLEKVVYGILQNMDLMHKIEANENDAASMVAKGSAWARVGDEVKTIDGIGIVQDISNDDASAIVQIKNWVDEKRDITTKSYSKKDYSKVF